MSTTASSSASSTTIARDRFLDLSQLPSVKDGSMTVEEESKTRRRVCLSIEKAGQMLKLSRVAISTAMVFFHNFYARHSFQEYTHRFEVAVACLLLAGKAEEDPRKVKDVLLECYKLKAASSAKGGGGSSPPPPSQSTTRLDPNSDEFSKLKGRVLKLERVILHTVGFEICVAHPYNFLVEQIKKLIGNQDLEYDNTPSKAGAGVAETKKSPAPLPSSSSSSSSTSSSMSSPSLTLQKMQHDLVKYAMSFANDSMQTSLCLQFEPQDIAMATVLMAAKFCKVRPVTGKDWFTILLQVPAPTSSSSSSAACSLSTSQNIQALTSIILQITELLLDRNGIDPTMVQQIRGELDSLQQMADNATRTTERDTGTRDSCPLVLEQEHCKKRQRIE